MERNLQLKSVRNWRLIQAQKRELVACGKYLAHTYSARWSPSPDESTEEEQMSAINMHNQSLIGIPILISHFLQEVGISVLLRNQSYSTASPARGWDFEGV